MNPEAALKRVVGGCRKAFVAVALFSLAINLLMLVVPIYMMQMYDRVIASGNVDTLLLLTVIAVVALLTMALVEMMRSRIMVRLGAWVDRSLSGPVLSGSMNDSLRAGGLTGASGLRELNTLRGFLTGAGIFPLLDAPWVPIFVGIIFVIHPTLGLLAVAGAVIVFLFALANDLTTRAPLKRANAAAAKALYRADAMVRNADVAAAMGMEPHLIRRWRGSTDEGLELQGLASDRAGAISSMAKFVRLSLQIAMLGLGAYFVTQGELTGGGMIAASIILSRAMAPVEQSINAWRGMVGAKSAYEGIKTLLSRTPASGDAMSLPRPSGQLSIEGVAFVPPGSSEPVLRGVTFDIDPGDIVGLIGSSASGKTTLARVLVGSWRPSAGHARMDGADVFVWDAADRGRFIGYLPQDVELFDGPVRENIARMGEPDSDAVVDAAQLAGVHELILRLPEGYETVIGDGGARLSGGQRQRIALARALYGDPALVILDEPNSNLDTEGEQALMEALAAMKERGVTTIVIAHRPSVLASVDKLVVMHQGRVEMQGPRDEVLAKVAPGSLDAIKRAALASDGAPKVVSPDGVPPNPTAGMPPGMTPGTAPGAPRTPPPPAASTPSAPAAAPTAPAPAGQAPVFRIKPGGATATKQPPAAATPADAASTIATPPPKPPPVARTVSPAPASVSLEVGQAVEVDPEPTEPELDLAPKRHMSASADEAASVAANRIAAAARAQGSGEKPVRRTAAPIIDVQPEPQQVAAPVEDEDDLEALFSRITASSPPPGAPAAATPVAQASTAPVTPAPAAPTPQPSMAEPKIDVASNASAPVRAAGRGRSRLTETMRTSPTLPGRLFPTGADAITVQAQHRRFTPRGARREA